LYNFFVYIQGGIDMKVKVDENSCIGCGACAAACPKVFELADEGYAKAKVEEVPAEDVETCKEAMEGCPVAAIQEE
jgi:ferredoxin